MTNIRFLDLNLSLYIWADSNWTSLRIYIISRYQIKLDFEMFKCRGCLPVTRYCQFLPFLAPIWLKASCHWKTGVCAQRLTKIKSFQKTRWRRKKRSERKGVHWSGVEEVNFRPHWVSNLPNHNIPNGKANKMDPGGWKWK